MKKLLTLLAFAALSCGVMTSCDDDDNVAPYQLRVLTFEDKDYKGAGNFLGKSDWSSLIDSPQNNGPLLYGESSDMYSWYDEGNTELLFGGFPAAAWGTKYFNGGWAISNYIEQDIAKGNNDTQLAIPLKSGHNNSKNFAVHFGYRSMPEQELPQMVFSDGKARIIDHVYIAATTNFINVALNGNAFSRPANEKDNVIITVKGFDANAAACGTQDFYLMKDGKIIEGWKMWDLSKLGEVMAIEFDMTSTIGNEYGMSVPAYFAFDDMAVRFYPEEKK